METTLNGYLQSSVRKNWEELALTDFNGVSFQYRDIARKVAKLHLLYEQAGVKRGDKIALCGKNSSQWAVAFISAITYGAVAVPILHEFKADNIHHLVTHSEAKLFYTDDAIWENLDPDSMNGLEGVIRLHDYSIIMSRNKRLTNAREHLNEIFGKRYPERFTPDDVVYYKEKKDELALINYTSGSMGFSKGVMLTYNNLWSNIQFTIDGLTFLNPGDGIVCMLPLAHMYGLIVELLHPLVKGCHVY
ncbi:AMP-binding protein, partial [uncultured Muribaculum sp.]